MHPRVEAGGEGRVAVNTAAMGAEGEGLEDLNYHDCCQDLVSAG